MGCNERIRPNTPFGVLKRSGQPLCLLQNAKKSLNCIEKGDPKEILMDNSYLQNRLQSREKILLTKEVKTRGCFKDGVSSSTVIVVAQWQ